MPPSWLQEGWLQQSIRVAPELAGQRLDRFLQARFTWRSRAWVQSLVRSHTVAPDGRPLKPAHIVRAGEVILIVFPPKPLPADEPAFEPALLHEDERLFVLDKPAGLPVHARGKQRHRALIHLLRKRYPDLGLDLAHRLDRETSGVLLLTKDQRANAHLKEQLRRGEVHKEYLTLTHGIPDRAEFEVALPLRPAAKSAIRMKMETHPFGLRSLTEFTVRARFPVPGHAGFALVHARPRTGRQHQIRAHLDAVGYPVVGDKIYGVPESVFLSFDARGMDDEMMSTLLLERHALHACATDFMHPSTGERLRVDSPLPADMAGFIESVTAGGDPCTSAGAVSAPSPSPST